MQGERQQAIHNKSLGQFNLEGIRPAGRGVPQIEVVFELDADGILKVTANDKDTGKSQDITIQANGGMSQEEIDSAIKDAEANAEADKAAKETADKLNEADGMIFQTEKQLEEFGDKLSDDKKQPVVDALAELKTAYESKDLEVITPALDKINEAWKVASEEMYKAQADAQGGAAGPDAGAGEPQAEEGSDVEDVDFEEVK